MQTFEMFFFICHIVSAWARILKSIYFSFFLHTCLCNPILCLSHHNRTYVQRYLPFSIQLSPQGFLSMHLHLHLIKDRTSELSELSLFLTFISAYTSLSSTQGLQPYSPVLHSNQDISTSKHPRVTITVVTPWSIILEAWNQGQIRTNQLCLIFRANKSLPLPNLLFLITYLEF